MRLADFDAAQRLVRRRSEVRQEHQETLRKLRSLVSEAVRSDSPNVLRTQINSGLVRPLAQVTEAVDEFYATVLTEIDAQLLRYGIEVDDEPF